MSEPKYREWILETIDSLRSRKARPDLERICRMVRRRHGSDPDRTRTELEKLIQEQTVLKVSYKGSISYRNAAKVQRKSRKKSEFTPVGSSAEAARERTKHNNLNNNGDSAHSFTDQEEGEQESEPSPDPQPQTASTTGKKQKPPSSPSSGNDCLSCGATTGCAAGSGCREEKASASREKGLGHQAGGGCPSPSHSHRTSAHDGVDASRTIPSKANAIRGGMERGLSGAKKGSSIAADTEKKTCPGSASSSNSSLPPKQKQTAPKLRIGGGGPKAAVDQATSDLGDRLVASVRSLSEGNLRGGSSAVARGQMKPLGLKEILGYLCSQERLSDEKLTRGKVKVALEREVARGRLRKTHCGNITLPVRGMVEESMAKNAPAARLLESSLQDRYIVEKEDEDEPMETDSGEDNQEEDEEEEEEEEEEEDPQSSNEEGGLSSPVVMETEPGPDNILAGSQIQTATRQESPQHQHHCGKDVSGAGSLTRTVSPSAQEGELSGCKSAQLKESTVTEDQLHTDAQDQMGLQSEERHHTSPGFKSSECKTEVGVSSCLLTPTASPKDSGQSEERGMNGSVSRGVYVKCEGVSVSPVEWTVSDVVSYFTAAGFPEQAVAFRTQEIDGKSLLLMQRNDVLTGLSIRLGPALKIYERHVKVLQKTHFEDDDC